MIRPQPAGPLNQARSELGVAAAAGGGVAQLAGGCGCGPGCLPAMPAVMTAKVHVKASVTTLAGTAACTDALSEPSQGDSGRPSRIMSNASTGSLGAAASGSSARLNRARQQTARQCTGPGQVRLP